MTSALLTGAAGGIGQEIAELLLAAGWGLTLSDLDEARLRELVEARGWPADQVRCRAFDVRDAAAWQTTVTTHERELGPLQTLLNVAGYLRPGRAHELTDEDVDRHFDINVKGVIHGTRAAVRAMVPRGAGHIVNVASLAALVPVPGLALYAASKSAVRSFSLAAAEDLRSTGVAVTTVCPDAVQTPMLELQRDYEQAALTFSGTVLSARDVAETIVNRAMVQRPDELAIPRHRALMARIANDLPGLGRLMTPVLRRVGLRRQSRTR